jgi:DNA-binding CsgD family transcriptional regulator
MSSNKTRFHELRNHPIQSNPIQSNPIQSNPIHLNIRCGNTFIAAWLTAHLATRGIYHDTAAALTLVCDWSTGFALGKFANAEPSAHQMIIVTGNTCHEYLANLWEQQPAALFSADTLDHDLPIALNYIAHDKRYCAVDCSTPLTPAERRALRYLAYTWDDKRIAACLCVNRQSISNTVSSLLHKLQLANRAAAALYYWGGGSGMPCGIEPPCDACGEK